VTQWAVRGVVGEAAVLDAIVAAARDLGGIQEGDMGGHFEGAAGARRGLLEEQHDVLALRHGPTQFSGVLNHLLEGFARVLHIPSAMRMAGRNPIRSASFLDARPQSAMREA
jgi:hypothetical protein